MENAPVTRGALQTRASWLRSVASKLPSRDVAALLDDYADAMLDRARRIDRVTGSPAVRRTTH